MKVGDVYENQRYPYTVLEVFSDGKAKVQNNFTHDIKVICRQTAKLVHDQIQDDRATGGLPQWEREFNRFFDALKTVRFYLAVSVPVAHQDKFIEWYHNETGEMIDPDNTAGFIRVGSQGGTSLKSTMWVIHFKDEHRVVVPTVPFGFSASQNSKGRDHNWYSMTSNTVSREIIRRGYRLGGNYDPMGRAE